jgi:hypothetical protein
MLPNTDHGKILLNAMVHLIRQVPWGENRDALEVKARALDAEGSFESGWDNYSTAARLWWKAELYNVAAQCRFPREGDAAPRAMIHALDQRLHGELAGHHDDDDVGESTRMRRNGLSGALPEITDGKLRDELLAYYRDKGFQFAPYGPISVSSGDDADWDDEPDTSHAYGTWG